MFLRIIHAAAASTAEPSAAPDHFLSLPSLFYTAAGELYVFGRRRRGKQKSLEKGAAVWAGKKALEG